MRIRTTLLLLLAVLMAGSLLWYLEGRKELDELRRRQASRLLRLEPERVLHLSFESMEMRIECRKIDGVWRLMHPVNARADAGEMDRILTALSTLEKSEVISRRDRREMNLSLQDFGLERPRGRIVWEDDIGQKSLLIGRDAPVGDFVYVMTEGADEILSVSSRLLTIMPDSVQALRDRILFHGDPRRAYRLEIRRAGGFLQVLKSDDGAWRLQQPIAARADAGAVRQFIDRIFEWRITDFVADTISDATVYGLDDAATQITVWTEGQEAGQTVFLGAAREQLNGHVYARRRDGQSVFAVRAEMLAEARVRPNDLRDRSLLPLKPQDIGSIHIELGDQSLLLMRDTNDTWEIRRPRRWKADPMRVAALVDSWAGARIVQFVDDADTNLTALGFTENALQITFHVRSPDDPSMIGDDSAVEAVTIRVGEVPPADGLLLVKKMNETFFYHIPDTVRMVTSWNPLFYRHREMIRLDPDRIVRLRQTVAGQVQTVERNGAGLFVPVPVDAGELSDAYMAELLSVLSNLSADEYLVDNPADWVPYGLDEPHVTWSIDLTGADGIRKVLMLGAIRADGRIHARTLGQEVVFLLAPEVTALLTKRLFPEKESPSVSAGPSLTGVP